MGRSKSSGSYIRDAGDDSDSAQEAARLLDGHPAKPDSYDYSSGGGSSGSGGGKSYGWFDVENPHGWMRVFVLGLCFLNSAYDSFAMNLVLILLVHTQAELSPLSLGIVATTAQIGKMLGQLFFGALALAPGIARTKIFVATQIIVIAGAVTSALALTSSEPLFVSWMIVSRFVMGIGIGGEYPLAAVLSADTTHFNSNSNSSRDASGRGRAMSALFLMQALGCLGAPVVVLLLITFAPPGAAGLGLVWRLSLLATAAPGAVLLYYRIILKDPAVAASLDDGDANAAGSDASDSAASAASVGGAGGGAATVEEGHRAREDSDAAYYDALPLATKLAELRRYGTLMFGTSAAWFLFDVVFYANAMFSATLLAHTTPLPQDAPAEDVHKHVMHLARVALVIAGMAVPGYWAGAMVIDRWGRKRIQSVGFALMAACYLAMMILYTRYTSVLEAASWLNDGTVQPDYSAFPTPALDDGAAAAAQELQGAVGSPALIHGLFTAFYGLTFFFGNAGPNLTTFIMPGECFPRHIAAAGHGISAAAGKLGAVLGSFCLPLVLDKAGVAPVLAACAATAALGALVTVQFTVETMNTKLGSAGDAIATAEGFEDV